MGKMRLFAAFANGDLITLRDRELNLDVTGRIDCIYLESGFHLPDTPHHFMVRILVTTCFKSNVVGTTREVYVNTID
jgi:hypothetical protein